MSGQLLIVVIRAADDIAVTVTGFLDHVCVLADSEAVFVGNIWVDAILILVMRCPGEVIAPDLVSSCQQAYVVWHSRRNYLNVVVSELA